MKVDKLSTRNTVPDLTEVNARVEQHAAVLNLEVCNIKSIM